MSRPDWLRRILPRDGLELPRLTRFSAWPDDGETPEGYGFRRLALYTGTSYALGEVNPDEREAWFKLYGEQIGEEPDPKRARRTVPLGHSVAKIRLF